MEKCIVLLDNMRERNIKYQCSQRWMVCLSAVLQTPLERLLYHATLLDPLSVL